MQMYWNQCGKVVLNAIWTDVSLCEQLQTHQWILRVCDVTLGNAIPNTPLESDVGRAELLLLQQYVG